MGYVGQDPVFNDRFGASTILNICTREQFKDKRTGEMRADVEWHEIRLRGAMAIAVRDYVRKGDFVHVQGKIKSFKKRPLSPEDTEQFKKGVQGLRVTWFNNKKYEESESEGNRNNSDDNPPCQDDPYYW